MERLFFPVLSLALQWFRPRYNTRLQFLEAQIRILRSRIDASRIVPTPKEKAELLRIDWVGGESMAHSSRIPADFSTGAYLHKSSLATNASFREAQLSSCG